jgi:glycosyltransferase involved in cell wall biosynthesis
MNRTVRILGTHGVPASYGGFETAAENVATYLLAQGWRVIVYCQVDGGDTITEDTWRGIERVNVGVSAEGWLGTSQFDLRSIRHAARHRDICLTFGYNTAVFNIWQRLRGIPNVINMDGIEWSRARWGPIRQAILYVNERIGCIVGNALIADHPVIADYLRRKAPARKVFTITYGSHAVTSAPTDIPESYGLVPGHYFTVIARPIPENSILDIVTGFSRVHRGHDLVVFGNYQPDVDPYHREVMDAAGDEVRFVGGIYEPEQVQALRFHSLGYLHGHTVGGTNPSLVEAMGAGNPVIAHDNPYNRWVAQGSALYFSTAADVDAAVTRLIGSPELVRSLQSAARARHAEEFTWEHVAGQYEELLIDTLPSSPTAGTTRERSTAGTKRERS